MVLSIIFLEDKQHFIAFINILWVSTVFSTLYLFLDTAARLHDFYVNLRVEVGKFYVRFLKIFYSETTGKFTLAMYFLSWTRIMSVACIQDMYNERWTQNLHRHRALCVWSRSTLLGLNKIPCLLYEQLFIYTTIWFKRNISLKPQVNLL
jgi:hypothetical protein